MKVLVIDAIAPEGIAYLRERGFQVDEVSSTLPREALLARLGEYEAIVTRSSTTVTPEFLAHARRLRILGRAGVVTQDAPRAILPEVSSTAVRDAVRAGRAGEVAALLPRAVLAYIEAQGLYRGP